MVYRIISSKLYTLILKINKKGVSELTLPQKLTEEYDMNKQKLKTKDIITITLLTLINVVIFYASSMLYMGAITIILMPVVLAIANSVVFFILSAKIQKQGAILIYCVILGVLGSYLPWIICYIVAGIIAEIILAKAGYGNIKALTLSYVIIQVMAGFASTIYPYVVTAKRTFEGVDLATLDEKSKHIYEASQMLISGGAVVVVIATIIAALLGAFIGIRIMKKHLVAIKKSEN